MDKIRNLDFAALTLQDALDLATIVEEEAKDRYEELYDELSLHHNAEVAAFFDKMRRVETKHEERLATRRKALFGDAPRAVRREMIFDIEAPEYDEVRATMTLRDALGAALRCEEKAYAFFDAAAAKVKDADVRALFEEFRAEEEDHQRAVLAEIEKLPPEAGPGLADVSDEPVAH